MINTFVGNLGHLLVIVSFVASLMAALAHLLSTQPQPLAQRDSYRRLARTAFWIHGLAVMGVVATLFYIIYNHLYEYHYAWSHSSNNLPTEFMISCFWEGQEGSFLLWIFWQVGLGLILMYRQPRWEASVMTVFALVQAFLASMILGVVVPGLDLKIGSSPFVLMRDAMEAPIFQQNPNYRPEDGTGLNPLLQNYWMVIHPPTLFLGFAATLVPFAFMIAGLWQRQYSEWIRPAMTWGLFAAGILGVGILMGAYWAYETLNFGGYWNWDPVENAVYIPWLVLVASLHVMSAYRKKGHGLKSAMILMAASFVLILYSTFLTRSGILGDASVHSFTDLGLSGQLLLYLLAFAAMATGLLAYRWREIPTSEKEVSVYSREFWVFTGATVLCLAAFQVLVPTSLPVYNAIVNNLGGNANLAPPADAIAFYTNWQMWFFVVIALMTGVGQYFWWKQMNHQNWNSKLTMPAIVALVTTTALIVLTRVDNFVYIVVLLAGVFAVVANGAVAFTLLRKQPKLSGGALAHVGVGLMLIGVMYSSGYSDVISINNSGLIYRKEFSDDMNRENVLLWRNTPKTMGNYEMRYKGPHLSSADFPGYIRQEDLKRLPDPYRAVAKAPLVHKEKTYFQRGDTIRIYPENTYYRVEYLRADGKQFTLYPRAQVNPNMGLLASPDIQKMPDHDLYTHVSSIPPPDQEPEWNEPETFRVAVGDTFIIHDFIAELVGVERVREVDDVRLGEQDAAVQANVRIYGKLDNYLMQPVFVVKDNLIGRLPATLDDAGLRLSLDEIDPNTGLFTFTANTRQQDWIILKAMVKPHINVLWIGSLLMSFGFGLAVYRRARERKYRRAPEVTPRTKPDRRVEA